MQKKKEETFLFCFAERQTIRVSEYGQKNFYILLQYYELFIILQRNSGIVTIMIH